MRLRLVIALLILNFGFVVTVDGTAQKPALPADAKSVETARIHYHRPSGDYAGWGLHVWQDTIEQVSWQAPLQPSGRDEFGVYWDVRLAPKPKRLGIIVHAGDRKDPGPDLFLDLDTHEAEVWLVSGRAELFARAPDVSALAWGDLRQLKAYWIAETFVVWPTGLKPQAASGARFYLHGSGLADLQLAADGVRGGDSHELRPVPADRAESALRRFPHLTDLVRDSTSPSLFEVPTSARQRGDDLLRGQVAVSVVSAAGELLDASGLQTPGVLDDLYRYDGPLGLNWTDGSPSLHLWAPTARSVGLVLFSAPNDAEPVSRREMNRGQNGVWSLAGPGDWHWLYYQYEVEVFVPTTGRIERHRVTDPYSRSLSVNSTHSQIVDLNHPATKPTGWDELRKPALASPLDIVLYELHVRDFSASDSSVPASHRGTYMAFTLQSAGTRHLESLARAGLTHVHLLPVFDVATIDEDPSTWRPLSGFSDATPDSEHPQTAIAAQRDADPYNWGYDPWHYGVPEGSYALNPQGAAPAPLVFPGRAGAAASSGRIHEFRSMVQALAGLGLRVVMDVVYNHTNASGLSRRSVLDKIVPGYYHRLNADGAVENSTCCQNTASEHAMMERLMLDDLVHWAVDYKVDGFRFDLMGHHMKRNMEKARDRLHELQQDPHGVDGSKIYLYGEGWDFGEVAGSARGINATQHNMAGTGIGTFNDRLRDAARGGNPFADRREQGFITGLYVMPSGFNQAGDAERQRLLESMDRIRVGLAGNLAQFKFRNHRGEQVQASKMDYSGYAQQPVETINYVSAHDNETLWDKIVFASASDATLAERVRMQKLGLSLVALSQGLPFFHAGVELLRSKSLDADSYNSGDWFNRLDFSYVDNNFGAGLPPAEKNQERWDVMRELLPRRDLKPGGREIQSTLRHFQDMLEIRRSSALFRLRTADDIQQRLHFHNTGPEQVPGWIVMSLADDLPGLASLDETIQRVFVLFNASRETQRFEHGRLQGQKYRLHPILGAGQDPVVQGARFEASSGSFTIPALTTAVFVQ